METDGVGLDDVDAVEIERATVSPEVLLYDWPRNGMEARFSVRYNVAAALAFGRVDLVAFDEAGRQDARLADAFARVRLVDGETRDGDATVVRIRTRDGRTLEKATTLRSVPGTAFNPISDDDLRQKFVDNAGRAFSAERTEAAADAWGNLSSVTDVREAMRTIC
jgi:2-methylcitrate dehydratase PrpD